MKKQIMAAFVASLIVISGAQAGIPVAIDANPEWAIEAGRWTERLKQWAETVKTLRKSDKCVQTGAAVKNGYP